MPVWVGCRVELSRRLFRNAGGREEDFIARRKFSSPSCDWYCRIAHPLRQIWTVPRADDFGDAFTQHGECGDENPEPPDAACRREEEASEGDEQKPNPTEYLGYSICDGGRTFVFVVAASVSVSPSA